LDRIYAFFTNKEQNKIEVVEDEKKIDKALESKYNLFVKNVSSHLEEKKHNIVVSDMMIFMNEGVKHTLFLKKHIKGFLTILSFFTPCLADEINEIVFNDNTLLFNQPFPEYDENKIKNDETMLPVQINGKLRMCVECKEDETQSEIEKKIMKDEKFLKYLEGKSAKKVIYVKGKIINFIV
jgi:leucyl-tRNA synthetase